MQAIAAPVHSRVRADKNLKYANDGSYESVFAQLRKLCFQYYGRAKQLGLNMDEDDVMGIMHVGFAQAKAKWKPDGGALFTTYLQTVCRNEFNARVEKEAKTIVALGMTSYDGLRRKLDDDGVDPLELMAGSDDSQEERMIATQEMRERLKSMSAGGRRLIVALLMSEREQGYEAPPKLRELAAGIGLAGDELRQVKVEILAKFGVRWN